MSAIKISTVKPTDHSAYFIDSNIWLAWFQNQRVESLKAINKNYPSEIVPKAEYTDYLIFLDELITQHLTYNEAEHGKLPNPKPKILFTSLLATEIVNAYSRNISQRLFKYDNNSSQVKKFKDYRRTTHYRTELRMLVDDILVFKDLCVCLDDQFNELDFFKSIKEFTNKYDFNDFFYMNFCKQWGCPIITHDGDFSHPEFQVLTMNQNMLQKSNK